MNSGTKKLINSVSHCVDDSLQGLVAVNSGLQILEGHSVVVRSDIADVKASGKVTLVSGGGSGHEPAHAGYVGPGMLSAAVAGAVFTSPPPTSILAAIRAVGTDNTGGTLLIVKNYTGDRLNFGLAAERAKSEGLRVEMVVVGEDCALSSTDKTAGRRGLAGTVLIHKIAGALAEEGRPLEEIVMICNDAIANMGTIGVSLSPCSVPGSSASFSLDHDEMELGLGIHGEAGVKRMKVLSGKETTAVMLEHMTNEKSNSRINLTKGDRVLLVINNLGGTSVLELNIVAKEAIHWLVERGVLIERAYCGSFMTALEMAGVSLTVMHLNDTRLRCCDAVTSAPGWSPSLLSAGGTKVSPILKAHRIVEKESSAADPCTAYDGEKGAVLLEAVCKACVSLKDNEEKLNALDRMSGDGDCGTTLGRGAQAILEYVSEKQSSKHDMVYPHTVLTDIAHIVERDMGGSSGALYSIFFTAAAAQLITDISHAAWCNALLAGIQAITKYGGAEAGDRTMLDALCPAAEALQGGTWDSITLAAQAAEAGAEKTVKMAAHAGRASYVSAQHLTQPDPGAQAVAIWIRAVEQTVIAYST